MAAIVNPNLETLKIRYENGGETIVLATDDGCPVVEFNLCNGLGREAFDNFCSALGGTVYNITE